MNLLKLLSLSSIATLALTGTQANNEECPNCENIEATSTEVMDDYKTETTNDSSLHLSEDGELTQDETESEISNKYSYNDYYSCYETTKEALNDLLQKTEIYAQKCENCNELTDEEKSQLIANFDELSSLIADLSLYNRNIRHNISGEDDVNYDNDIMLLLHDLENRIDILQSAFNTINLMPRRPYIDFYSNPYSNIYGYYYRYTPAENESSDEETSTTKNKSNKNIDTYNKLRIPSNIDTYGPQYRNIDTFFNTALLDENMFDYNNGMNYGIGYMGNPYMFGGKVNGYNGSNATNNNSETTTNEQNEATRNINIETSTPPLNQPKKFKFGKNIDTYNGETLRGNINTMGGKKVTDFVKETFKKYFKKEKNKENNSEDLSSNNQITNNEINEYVDNFIEKQASDMPAPKKIEQSKLY